MSESNEERLAKLEVFTEVQDQKLKEHSDRLKILEESNQETIELRYDLRSLSDKLSTFVDSQKDVNDNQKLVNDSINEAIQLMREKTIELENAPKNFLWNITKEGVKSLFIKIFPWIILAIGAVYTLVIK